MILWFAGRVALVLCSCFFLFFGVVVLISSYSLDDPFLFIMTFFASTMMILISAAIGLGVVIRTIRTIRAPEDRGGTAEKSAGKAPSSQHEANEERRPE